MVWWIPLAIIGAFLVGSLFGARVIIVIENGEDKGWGLVWPIMWLGWFLIIVPFILMPCFVGFWFYEKITGKKITGS